MRRYLIALNLQHFAGETAIEVNGETIEIDPNELDTNDEFDMEVNEDETEVDTDEADESDETGDDAENDDETDEQHEETVTDKPEEKTGKDEPNDTGKAVIAERKKWQAKVAEAEKNAVTNNPVVKKLLDLAGVKSLDEFQAKLDQAEAARIAKQQNISPEQAQARIAEQREKENMQKEIRRLKFSEEARTLKTDPFYADIDLYADQYAEIAERTGQTLEQVYLAQRGKERMKERERELEEQFKANREKRDKTKVNTTASGEQAKPTKIDLAPHLKEAAEFGVKKGTFKDLKEAVSYYKKYGSRK